MNAEAISPVELEPEKSSPPTTLHLFRYKGPELSNLQTRASTALQLEENFNRTELSLGKLNSAKDARLNRLSQTETELSEQLMNTRSSASYGAAYLKMRDELPNLFPNLSPKDFMEFFNLCLRINTLLNKQAKDSVGTRGSEVTLLKSLSRMNASKLSLENDKMLDSMSMNPPEWFSGNKRSWRTFVMSRANLTVYLNADLFQSLASRRAPLLSKDIFNLMETLPGYTKEGEFPDWFSENSETLPIREDVEEELEEDKEQEVKIVDGQDRIEKQQGYLITTSVQKAQKAIERLQQLAIDVFPSFQNFSDVTLFAKAADTKAVNLKINSRVFEEVVKSYTSPENVLKNQEPIALFIERKLKEGKIIHNTQDPIDTHFIDQFLLAFNHIKAQQKDGSTVAEFEALRTTDKKAYDALKHGLKPFIEILTTDEISLLEDLLSGSKDKPIELFIWDMAGAISSNFKEKGHMPNPGDLHDLGKFSTSFLRNHSQWTYQQLQESLTEKDQRKTSFESYEQPISDMQEEIESTTEEIAQGNLGGWHIFYTDNRSLDERHLTEVGGQTLEERERALQELLLKEQHLPSIKLGSIIRAFDWLVAVPEEVEQVRIKKDIGGDKFKKLKRAGLRIFYDMYPQEKRLIFFLHQKQAWKYGF